MGAEGEAMSEEVLGFDVLIIGAGPAGLYAAYYAGFRASPWASWTPCPSSVGRCRRCTRRR